jgi:isoquinoline 1-oxidoreductase subunit beta
MPSTFLSRRAVLASVAAVGGGLSLGLRVLLARERAQTGAAAAEINAWIEIAPDETVIIRVARSEMGQGVLTAVPMLIADELECDWARVQAELVSRAELVSPTENLRRGHVWGAMSTGASRSISGGHEHLRVAGQRRGKCSLPPPRTGT